MVPSYWYELTCRSPYAASTWQDPRPFRLKAVLRTRRTDSLAYLRKVTLPISTAFFGPAAVASRLTDWQCPSIDG